MSELSAIEPYVSAATDVSLGGAVGYGVPRRVCNTNEDEDLQPLKDKSTQRNQREDGAFFFSTTQMFFTLFLKNVKLIYAWYFWSAVS